MSRTLVSPGGGWIPVFRLDSFEVWIVRYTCGHGYSVQFGRDALGGDRALVGLASNQMRNSKRFICTSCAYDGDAPGIWAWVAEVRRLR